MHTERLIKLRNRQPVTLWDTNEKLFHRIQLNKTTPFICWERWVSRNKTNWIKWNECLTLREALSITFKKKEP